MSLSVVCEVCGKISENGLVTSDSGKKARFFCGKKCLNKKSEEQNKRKEEINHGSSPTDTVCWVGLVLLIIAMCFLLFFSVTDAGIKEVCAEKFEGCEELNCRFVNTNFVYKLGAKEDLDDCLLKQHMNQRECVS